MSVEERIAEIQARVDSATMQDKGPDVLFLLKYVRILRHVCVSVYEVWGADPERFRNAVEAFRYCAQLAKLALERGPDESPG